KVNRMWKDKGDLGLVAEDAISARRQKPLESTPLTVAKVYENLDAIASESGEGSQERKVRLLSDLLGNATPREAKYIVRMVVGKMRLGVADMTIVDALALTFGTKVQLFSRHLENITEQFPEIVEGLRTAIRGRDAIVEGEAVPVDSNTGEFLPFQEVSRRRGRKTDVDRMAKEFPVTLFSFDCLLRDGEDLTPRPYTERRKALDAVVGAGETIRHSTSRVTDSVKEAEKFFDEALQAGCEGLMAKALDSPYEAGARGFQWIKFKKEYSAALSDTIDLVVVGAFAGRGKRAGSYGALLMAAYDEETDMFRTTCKLGTGF